MRWLRGWHLIVAVYVNLIVAFMNTMSILWLAQAVGWMK
jgi:hypothetical protein